MSARIEHLETSGTFSLDGGTWDVDNNVWIVGDDEEVIVIDPAHNAEAVEAAVDGRKVQAILLTHGHDDHIRQVMEVQRRIGGPIHLNAQDRMLWDDVYGQDEPDAEISAGGCVHRRRHEAHRHPHPRPLPRVHVLLRRGDRPRRGWRRAGTLFRGHTVLRRARCDRPLLQQL